MKLERALAEALIEQQPLEAARALEAERPAAAARVLAEAKPAAAAEVLCRMAPNEAAATLRELGPETGGACLAALRSDRAALLLRRLGEPERAPLLDALPKDEAQALRSLLRFPEETAGALMDPHVLALPADITVREALGRARTAARNARYNVYVVDREHKLVGVLNLRELLMAKPGDAISAVMTQPVRSLPARAGRRAIVDDPGWREAHSLPVVDEDGTYLGALRYRTLRALEQALPETAVPGETTARALGDLFRAGAGGLLESLAAGEPPAAGRIRPAARENDDA